MTCLEAFLKRLPVVLGHPERKIGPQQDLWVNYVLNTSIRSKYSSFVDDIVPVGVFWINSGGWHVARLGRDLTLRFKDKPL